MSLSHGAEVVVQIRSKCQNDMNLAKLAKSNRYQEIVDKNEGKKKKKKQTHIVASRAIANESSTERHKKKFPRSFIKGTERKFNDWKSAHVTNIFTMSRCSFSLLSKMLSGDVTTLGVERKQVRVRLNFHAVRNQ